MARSPDKHDRSTTILSTLVAVILLAVGVTARQSGPPPAHEPSAEAPLSNPAEWESDLRFQLETSFRRNPRERDARLERLDEVIARWDASPQTVADRELLLDWLSEGMVRSMPGSVAPLSPPPTFGPQNFGPQTVAAPRPAQQPVPQPALLGQNEKLLPQTSLLPTPQPDLRVTPTPYDPFEGVAEQTVRPADLPLTQPPTVTPTHGRPVPSIENASLQTAPRPDTLGSAPAARSSLASLTTIDPESEAADDRVAVNLTELAARIAGYHEGLAAVETTLRRAREVDLSLLAEQLDHLTSLSRDYRFVRLYYDSLTPAERRMMPAPQPLEASLQQLARQVDRYEAAQATDFLGSLDSAAADRIAELRELLTTLGQQSRP